VTGSVGEESSSAVVGVGRLVLAARLGVTGTVPVSMDSFLLRGDILQLPREWVKSFRYCVQNKDKLNVLRDFGKSCDGEVRVLKKLEGVRLCTTKRRFYRRGGDE
jgi:hypothetical protein